MKYTECLNYIHSVSWKGSMPGLERITKLCSLLGNPQDSLRFVHVAGTNGKGSVCAMTSSVLRNAGYKVGTFTSPYLLDFCERMAVNGVNISHDDLCRATEKVRPLADSMEDAPTEFELITAITLVFFAEQKCDIVVFECGMGGRLDSTNVISESEVSVITNIALDHTKYLGDTKEKIAGEKAGIIKNSPVVVGFAEEKSLDVIRRKCVENGVEMLHSAEEIKLENVTAGVNGISFSYLGNDYSVPLCGLYQKVNVRTVLSICNLLREKGWKITDENIRDGLRSVKWIGRFEALCDEPRIIFDGAHNPDGAKFTKETFLALYPGKKAIIISGVMADKEYGVMAKDFAQISDFAYTITADNPRALSATAWADALSENGICAEGCANAKVAVEKAIVKSNETGSPILCVGSLYIYGEIVRAVSVNLKQ